MLSIIIELLFCFLNIGLFSIGGGYATIPLIQEQIVNIHGWLSIKEFTDIITISQMTPGPLAVNTSTFVGIRIAGLFGAIVATFGCVISGFIISILLYKFFHKYKNSKLILNILNGLKATSVGLISASASTILFIAFFGTTSFNISLIHLNILAVSIFILSLFMLRRFKTNPIVIIILSGLVGYIVY